MEKNTNTQVYYKTFYNMFITIIPVCPDISTDMSPTCYVPPLLKCAMGYRMQGHTFSLRIIYDLFITKSSLIRREKVVGELVIP